MQVPVRIKPGRKFNRRERGELVTYTAGARLTVSQHVYETFKDAFDVVGLAPEPLPSSRPAVPDTDDEVHEPIGGRQAPPLIVLPDAMRSRRAESDDAAAAPEATSGDEDQASSPDPAPAETASTAASDEPGGGSSSTRKPRKPRKVRAKKRASTAVAEGEAEA